MITPALISGTVIGRIRMRTWIIFVLIWVTVLYDSVAHWVWSAWEEDGEMKYGWLRERGVLDFAGESTQSIVYYSSSIHRDIHGRFETMKT
jgi:Amt family ammonium transporter